MKRKMKQLLVFMIFCLSVSSAQEKQTITSEPGKTVTLPCRAPNDNKILTGVEWSRPDLQPEYVLLLRDGHIISDNQQPSFKDRAYLQDRRMEGRDMSLILENVSTADEGRYECQVLTPGRKREKRAVETISIIDLRVVAPPPGPSGGLTEDGGKEDGGKEDGGKEGGSADLAAGVAVFAVGLVAAAVAVVGFVFYKKRTRNQSVESSQPSSIELQPLESV